MPEWMICVDGVVETRQLMGLDPEGAALDWAAARGPQGNAAGELKVLVAKAGTVTDMTDPFEPVYKVDLKWVPVDRGGGSRWALAAISGGPEGLDKVDLGVGDDQEPERDLGQVLDRVAAELEAAEWTTVRTGLTLSVRAVDVIRPPCAFVLQLKGGPFTKGDRVGLFDDRLPYRTAGVVEAVREPDRTEVRLVEGDMEGMVVVVSPTSLELMDS